MNFFKRFAPTFIPPHIANQGDNLILRERNLQGILLVFSFAGFWMLLLAARNAYFQQSVILLAGYACLYLVLCITFLSRAWPYSIRSYITLGILIILGLIQLGSTGSIDGFRMLILGTTALTALLFDYKHTIGSNLIGLLAVILASQYSSYSARLSLPALSLQHEAEWLTSTGLFLILSIVLSSSITILKTVMENNLQKQLKIVQTIEIERNSLESRVREQTSSISHRLAQAHSATELIRSMISLTDPDELIREMAELIRARFDLYYVGIFIVDPSGQNAHLQSGTGEAGRRMLAEGHRLAVGGSSMIGWAIANRQTRIALDVGSDAVRFSNPNLPLTRAELALPLIAKEKVLGAVTIQSSKFNSFDEQDISLLQSLVESLAAAIHNDRTYKDEHQSLEEIRTTNREYLQHAWAESLETYGELNYSFENPSIKDLDRQANQIELPLLLRDEVIGTMTLDTDRSQLTSEEAAFVDNITNQTAIALENARLLQNSERRAIQEQKLNQLSSRFSRAMSIDEILQAAAQELGQLPSVGEVSIHLSPANITSIPSNPEANHNGENGKELKA